MKKIMVTFLSVVLLATALTGCGKTKKSNSDSAGKSNSAQDSQASDLEKTKLRVAVQSYYCSSLMGLIQKEGWAEDYNLELEYSVFSSGATINEAMGEWDIAVTGGAFIYALANYNCKLIANQIDGTAYNDIMVRNDSEYYKVYKENDTKKLAELVKGSDILTNVGQTGHYGLVLWLESIGLTAADVNLIGQDMSTIYASWTAGEGDLAVLTFPYDTYVTDSTAIGSLESAGGKMYEATVCTKDAYENNYDAVVRFAQLLYKASDALAADEDLALETVCNWYKDNGKEIDEDTVKGECEAKPFVTSEQAKQIDMKKFVGNYSEYLASQQLIENSKVDVILNNCAEDVLEKALAD